MDTFGNGKSVLVNSGFHGLNFAFRRPGFFILNFYEIIKTAVHDPTDSGENPIKIADFTSDVGTGLPGLPA